MDTSLAADKIIYPESDGKPMGESDVHVNEIVDLLKMFQARYRDDANVYVGANMLCYYEEGVDSKTGERLLRPREETRLREKETRLREAESNRRKDAEAEVARLRGELDKLRKANGK